MSDLSVTIHNLGDLLQGKIDFDQFEQGEVALIEQNIKSLPPAVQGAANLALSSLKSGASSLVGAGMTAIGPILAASTDTQATQVENILSLVGVRTTGVLSIAEHAALTTIINGLKAGLDSIGLKIATQGAASNATKQPDQEPAPLSPGA